MSKIINNLPQSSWAKKALRKAWNYFFKRKSQPKTEDPLSVGTRVLNAVLRLDISYNLTTEIKFLNFCRDPVSKAVILSALLQKSTSERHKIFRRFPDLYQEFVELRDFLLSDSALEFYPSANVPDHLRGIVDLNLEKREALRGVLATPIEMPQETKSLFQKIAKQNRTFQIPSHEKQMIYKWSIIEDEARKHDRVYRGYIQVDHAQIPEAVDLLSKAKSRLKRGELIDFKFLLSTFSFAELLSTQSAEKYGFYGLTDPSMPVIAVYAQNLESILEILEELSKMPRWEYIEKTRLSRARREGSNAYIDKRGREWRTLCYNSNLGTAEEFLEAVERNGQDWRDIRLGKPTGYRRKDID